MKNPLNSLFEKLATFFRRIFGGKQAALAIPCEFCGKTDHASSDCPNAAKYKLFHVDRE